MLNRADLVKYLEPILLWIIFIATFPIPFYLFLFAGWVPLLFPFVLSSGAVFSLEATIVERIAGLAIGILYGIPIALSYFAIHLICLKKKGRLVLLSLTIVALIGTFFKIYLVVGIGEISQKCTLIELTTETARMIGLEKLTSVVIYISFGFVVTFLARRFRSRVDKDTKNHVQPGR